MKIGILVLSTVDEAFQTLKCAQQKSWVVSAEKMNVSVVFVEGDGQAENDSGFCLNGNTLTVSCDDTLVGSLNKTIMGLDYMFNQLGCTIVFRTNLSSFIDMEPFLNFVSHFNVNAQFYGGILGATHILRERVFLSKFKRLSFFFRHFRLGQKVQFASGAGFFIGRDVFDDLRTSEPLPKVIDDVGVALIGAEQHLRSVKFSRIWVNSSRQGAFKKRDFEFDGHGLIFHYRFKSQYRDVDALLLSKFGDVSFRENWLFGSLDGE